MPHSAFSYLVRTIFLDLVKQDPDSARRHQAFRESRRNFLKTTLKTTAGLAVFPGSITGMYNRPQGTGGNKVIIVGAGLAGLQAAYQLKKRGITATLYEGNDRIGGRMFTMPDLFEPGMTTDFGGEFIDSSHEEILQLTKELHIDLYDLRMDQLAPKSFFFGGKHLNEADLREAIRPFVPVLIKDIHSLPPVISYQTAASFQQLDQQSIIEYIHSIGIQGWLFDFLNVVLTREYGMEATEQSAINFLIMFSEPVDKNPDYELFGADHEVLKIKGGSQRLTQALGEQLRDQVVTGHSLTEINTRNERYELIFKTGHQSVAAEADYVLLAIPFSILRNIPVNIAMPAQKTTCINEIGYGNSCKFMIGMNSKPWRKAGWQGYSFNDLSFGCGWDSSQMQSDQSGSFTVFGGGLFEQEIANNTEAELIEKIVPALETMYPGATAAYTGKKFKYCWSKNPWSKAGYSSFKKGQWSTLAGWEAQPVGNIYFAGEHTSLEFQGYMNGAAETGKVAAEMIAEKILAVSKN